MTKKVLIISASPRRGGNSDVLCDRFLAGAQEVGHDVEKIFLRDKDIRFCRGCYACVKNNGKCIIKDDMAEILHRMVSADVVVLATPVYFYCMNAQLKTVIDRSVARYTEITDKDMYLIATAAEDEMSAMEGTITSFRSFLACLDDVREAGLILAKGVDAPKDVLCHSAMADAYEMGKAC